VNYVNDKIPIWAIGFLVWPHTHTPTEQRMIETINYEVYLIGNILHYFMKLECI